MEEGGPCVPTDGVNRSTDRPNLHTDSFRDDIQAIGRAVERLRDGFASAGTDTSSPKPTPVHDSARWSGLLSSSTLGSAAGEGVDVAGRQLEEVPRQQQRRRSGDPNNGSPPSPEAGRRVQQATSTSPNRELLPARGRGSERLAEGATNVEASVLDQTNASNGRLSLRELRSANEARRFYSDERAKATAEGTTTGDQEDEVAAAPAGAGEGALVPDEEKGLVNTGSRSSSRSTSISRSSRKNKRHRQARGDSGRPDSSSGEGRGVRTASAAAATGLSSGKNEQDTLPRTRTQKGDLLRTRSDMSPPLLVAVDGRTAAPAAGSESSLFSLPLMGRSRSPSMRRSGGRGRNNNRGEFSVEEVGSSAASAVGAAAGVAGGAGRKTGAVGAVAGEGVKPPTESGSLFELRDALRSREKELLRLKRDVAVVATNAGGFKHLAASLGSSADMNNDEMRSFAFGHRHRRRRRRRPAYSEGVGGGTEDSNRPGSKSSPSGRSDLDSSSGFEGHGRGGAGGKPLVAVEQKYAAGELLPWRRPDEPATASSNFATAPPFRTGGELSSPRQMMPPPPPRIARRQHQPSTSAISQGTDAALAVSGSPLVASAHEGLRQMRAVLEQRALEAERTKGDAKNMTESLNDVSARLRRSERKRNTQVAELAAARAEADRLKSELSSVLARHRVREKAAAEAAAAQREEDRNDAAAAARAATAGLLEPAQQQQLRKRDAIIGRLRDKLEAASGELSEEQAATASLRARLEASEKEARRARENATAAEEEAGVAAAAAATARAAQAAEQTAAAAAAERAQGEAAAAAAELRSAEEEGRRRAREAQRARESLKAEKEGTARLALELEAAVRERTQAVEKLAAAEEEAGRLRVDLSSVSTTAEEIQRERDTAQESLRLAVAELANITAALVLAREGQEAERGRSDRESKRAAALEEELVASEARRKVQEEEISLVRKQVSRLDAKIEGDMSREKAKSDATARASVAGAEREANLLRASLRETEAQLLASRERERLAADAAAAGASLKTELVVARDTAEKAERALATARERARAAEAGADAKDRQAERAAEAARQDKDTLKRGLVASQTACAELRAERLRLLSELEQAASSAAVAAATAAAAAAPGCDSCFSSPTGGGDVGASGLRDGGGASAAAAAASAAHTDLEGRLALALAEAAEARAEVQRLKRKLTACDRQYKMAAAVQVSTAQGLSEGADDDGFFLGEGRRVRRERLQEGLRESCRVMNRVATALSAAADARTGGTRSGGGGGGGSSELDDPRWIAGKRRRRGRGGSAGSGGRQHSLAPAPTTQKGSGRRRSSRRRRAFSVDSCHSGVGEGDGDRYHHHDDADSFGDTSDEGSLRNDAQRVVSRADVREVSTHLRFEAARLLGVREDERKVAEGKVARLRQDLRDSEGREAEITARLEESRELSREQTGFVEGVWKERHRLESQLAARREEVERLRAGEDAARAAATVLDGKVEDLSAALKQEQARAKREAEAAVAAEARDAMEALRKQLDDLRKEVDRAKQDQKQQARDGGSGGGGGGGGTGGGESNLNGPGSGFSTTIGVGGRAGRRRRGGGDPSTAAGVGVVASPSSPPSFAVLEGEFQRLRAKYEKAKGRIVALEELVAASRRVSAQARREFQGALGALKMSQELLLRIHRQRQGRNNANIDSIPAPPVSDYHHGAKAPPKPITGGAPAQHHHQQGTTRPEGQEEVRSGGASGGAAGGTVGSAAPGGTAAAEREGERRAATETTPSPDAHVHELASQASKLRGMSRDLKRLLQVAAGEVQGALEDTRDSLGVAAAAATATAVGTQTGGAVAATRESVDALEEKLREVKRTAGELETERSRLGGELDEALGELSRVQGLLRDKTAEAEELEARVARLEAEGREAREGASAADDRLAEAEATEAQLSDTRARLDAALAVQGELRSRCAELSLASGAFAAEVAKQKEDRARSEERARLAAEASAAELRERTVDFSRASETAAAEAAAERGRLERMLAATREEAQEVDSDVAQVLDALSASEKERRRLEGELERQTKLTGAAQLATRAAEGAAAQAQEDVDQEREALCEKAGRLQGVVQLGSSRLKESLERETERRQQLDKECKVLAARATDLEAALISASSEVRKAAKLAAERGARYDRDAAALKEKADGLKAELEAKEEKLDQERGEWEEEKKGMREELTEATEGARREGKAEEQRRTADVREREQRDCAALRKEISEITETLQAETCLRAEVAQEISTLKQKVAELETALEKAIGAARLAGEAARKAAANNPMMSQLQAEMRSVISGLEPGKQQGEREKEDEEKLDGLGIGVGGAHRRRRVLGQEESDSIKSLDFEQTRREGGRRQDVGGVHQRRASDQADRHRSSRASLRRRSATVRRDERGDGAAAVDAAGSAGPAVVGNTIDHGHGSRPGRENTPRPTSLRPQPNAEEYCDVDDRSDGDISLAGPVSTVISGVGPATTSAAAAAAAAAAAKTDAVADKEEVAVPVGRAAAAEQASAVVSAALPMEFPAGGGSSSSGVGVGVGVRVGAGLGTISSNNDGNDDDEDDDHADDDGEVSFSSSAQSGFSSTTRTSVMSSSLTLAVLPPPMPVPPQPRRGSVVVRGDWKAGQRDAFSELDRKASMSSLSGVGGVF